MLSALLATLLPLETLDIPAGYYTVAELGVRLRTQAVPVTVGDSCAADVYAIRSRHETWGELRKALVADERLTVRQDQGKWRVERSFIDKTTSQVASRKYLAAGASSVYALYGPAARICRDFEGLSPEDRSTRYEAWSATSGKSPLAYRIHDLVYSEVCGELTYGLVAIGSTLTAPGHDLSFCKPVTVPFTDWLPTILPSGSLRDLRYTGIDTKRLTDDELSKLTQSLQLSYEITVDPLTLAIKVYAVAFSAETLQTIYLGSRDHLSETVNQNTLWEPSLVASLAARTKQSDAALEEARLKSVTKLPSRPIRVSEALLRCAEQADVDLVYCVPCFSDYKLTPLAAPSIAAIIATANAGKIDPDWLDRTANEEASILTGGLKEPLTLSKRLTTVSAGRCLVVRNEMRFLDSLSCSPSSPSNLDNDLLADRMTKFDSLCEQVVKLNVPAWQSSLFASNYLAYCSPLSFRPYAAAIRNSTVLRRALAKATDGQDAIVPFGSIEDRAKGAFIKALGESVHNREILETGSSNFFERVKEGNLRLRLTKSGSRYDLRLEQALPSTFPERTGKAFEWVDIPRWSGWLQNVDCSL